MITILNKNLKNNILVAKLNKFLFSPYYIAFVAILLVISEVFSLETAIHSILLITSVIIPTLFCDDMTPLIPGALMIHISMSKKTLENNSNNLLMDTRFIVLLSIATICLISRLIFDLVRSKERRHRYPRFLIGLSCISLAYLIAGLFSSTFSGKSVLFGLLEVAGLTFAYFYLSYTIDWKNFKKEYFAWVFLFFGLAVVSQGIILTIQNVDQLRTGWGMRNDIAGMIAMCIASAGYLVIKKKAQFGWIFVLLMFVMLTCASITGSRAGFAATLLISITSIVLIFIFAKGKFIRIFTAGMIVIYATIVALLFIFMNDLMVDLFGRSIGIVMDYDIWHTNRIELWKQCFKAWTQNPVFGVGWYHEAWADFAFPARCHGTHIQLLTSTGIFGLLMYLFHRFETLLVTFKKPNLEKTFAFLCILGLLLASVFDCHFFNIWPGLSYGFLLAFIEKQNENTKN